MKSFRIVIALLGVIAVFFTGIAVFLSTRCGVFQYSQEWVKALLQAGLIGILGIVTSLVLESFKDGLQRRRDESKLKFDVFNEINRSYLDVKLVRRRIQASGKFREEDIDFLNEKQVVFELHGRTSAELFCDPEAMRTDLRAMESYINEATNDPSSEQRKGFVGKGFKQFSEPYHRLAELMRNDIGHVSMTFPRRHSPL